MEWEQKYVNGQLTTSVMNDFVRMKAHSQLHIVPIPQATPRTLNGTISLRTMYGTGPIPMLYIAM